MLSKDLTLRDLMEVSCRYVIPRFQRYYSWNRSNWERLWDSLGKLQERVKVRPTAKHYVGAIVGYDGREFDWNTIDGQQRGVTICLIFAAIRDTLKHHGSVQQIASDIHIRYLSTSASLSTLEVFYRVLPRGTGGPSNDQQAFQSVMERYRTNANVSDIPSGGIRECYEFFLEKLEDLSSAEILGLTDLLLKNVTLTKITLDEDDDPYTIFETLNDTGEQITPADCLRNFFYLKTPEANHEAIGDRWTPIEVKFPRPKKKKKDREPDKLTLFCHHYFMMKLSRYFPLRELYFEVQDYVNELVEARISSIEAATDQDRETATLQVLLSVLHDMGVAADSYLRVTLVEVDGDPEISDALTVLCHLEEGPSLPLRMDCHYRFSKGDLSKVETLSILRSVENFLVRRHVAGVSAKSGSESTRVMPVLCGQPALSIKQGLARATYPTDSVFMERLKTADVGSGQNKRFGQILLKRWEEYAEGKGVLITWQQTRDTVEHILPKTTDPKKVATWRESLGDDYDRVHNTYCHTLGNLCFLVQPDNSKNGTRSFVEKKKVYKRSSHRSAQAVSEYDVWDEGTILSMCTARAQDLLTNVYPHLDPEAAQRETALVKAEQEKAVALIALNHARQMDLASAEEAFELAQALG